MRIAILGQKLDFFVKEYTGEQQKPQDDRQSSNESVKSI